MTTLSRGRISSAPLNLLCVEPVFPGRLGPAVDWLVRKRGYRAWFAFNTAAAMDRWPASVDHGLTLLPFNVGGVARESMVAWSRHLERSLCYAYGAWEVIDAARIRPVDVILGHSGGLGSSLFLPVSYPRIPIVQRFHYFMHARTNDLADEDAATLPADYVYWRRSANAMELLELENGVVPWTPSHWQRDLYPAEYRSDFHVIPGGVDTDMWQRGQERPSKIAGRSIDPMTRVVTFVATVPDRVRGFDRFVELASRLLREQSDTVCIAVGSGTTSRMLDVREFGVDFAAKAMETAGLTGHERFWSLGNVDAETLRHVLIRSNAHVYLGRAHPCARSLFEALAVGAPVAAWDSPPVREVVTHEETGLIGAGIDECYEHVDRLLSDREFARSLGDAAAEWSRAHIALDQVMPALADLLEEHALGA